MPVIGNTQVAQAPAWTPVSPWAMFTLYLIGPPASVVTYDGETYVVTTSHTSTGVFDPTKWAKIAAKGLSGNDTGANHIVGVNVHTISSGVGPPGSLPGVAGDVYYQIGG